MDTPHIAANDDERKWSMVDHALHYAARGWPIFAVSRSKKPFKGTHGFKDATTDPALIEAMWGKHPEASIALATGHGLVVLDVDGPEGLEELRAWVRLHEPLPATLTARTGRGAHIFLAYNGTDISSHAHGNLHVRGRGGFVVLAPSLHPNGRRYEWVDPASTVAPLTDELKELMQHDTRKEKVRSLELQRTILPAHLAGTRPRGLARSTLEAIRRSESTAYPGELPRVKSALAVIPAVSYEIWYKVGMILQSLQWIRSDGTDLGFELWDEWSQGCDQKYPGIDSLETKWRSFGRNGEKYGTLGIGSLFHLAIEHGWKDIDLKVNDHGAVNDSGVNGNASASAVLPAGLSQPAHAIVMDWPDGTRKVKGQGVRPQPTIPNVAYALSRMGYRCSYDVFKNKMRIAGEGIEAYEGPLTDAAVLAAYSIIYNKFRLDAGDRRTRTAIETMCTQNRFDPVVDYFNALQWDYIPRLDEWLHTYCGAEDNLVNRAIGPKVLIAAVRRQFRPGTKFDQLLVLEGPQGTYKSTLLRTLAVKDEWFKDRDVFHIDNRGQQEAMDGALILEISELKGLRKAEVAAVQAFLSRQEDTARPAYGHYEISNRRRAIAIGTTNESTYLQADENRRFWPVETREINIERFTRDRDQLWAEAVARERKGESIGLERGLWKLIGDEQLKRREVDEWSDTIRHALIDKTDTSVTEIWTMHLHEQISRLDQRAQTRIAKTLVRLGFERYRLRDGKELVWRYRRKDQ